MWTSLLKVLLLAPVLTRNLKNNPRTLWKSCWTQTSSKWTSKTEGGLFQLISGTFKKALTDEWKCWNTSVTRTSKNPSLLLSKAVRTKWMLSNTFSRSWTKISKSSFWTQGMVINIIICIQFTRPTPLKNALWTSQQGLELSTSNLGRDPRLSSI